MPSFVLQRRSLQAQLRATARAALRAALLRHQARAGGRAVGAAVAAAAPAAVLHRLYPIACWLLPCHLLLGLLLGRWLQRQTASAA